MKTISNRRAKRASGKNRYYLYGYIIRTLLKILFWWMYYSYVFEVTILTGHYSYVFEDTILTQCYSDRPAKGAIVKSKYNLYGFAILTPTSSLFWQTCYSDTFVDTNSDDIGHTGSKNCLRRLYRTISPCIARVYRFRLVLIACCGQDLCVMCYIRGEIIWFRTLQAAF